MGGTSWSEEAAERVHTERSTMSDDRMRSEVFTSSGMDPLMNPRGVKFRESCDSESHPESNAIGIGFDVTGSMGGIPLKWAREKLNGLMKMLVSQGVIPDPQILFAAIGDTHCDSSPLQIGQFESGNESDTWLTKIYLEGGGGHTREESYINFMYWAARHTKMDCLIKRSKKGYLFVIGDEAFYPTLSVNEVKTWIGDSLQKDLTAEEVLLMAEESFEVFRISVNSHQYPDGNNGPWKELMGQRAIYLENPDLVCEMIAAQIAAMEGIDVADIKSGLKKSGLSVTSFNTIEKGLVLAPSTSGRGLSNIGTVTGGKLPMVKATGSKRVG